MGVRMGNGNNRRLVRFGMVTDQTHNRKRTATGRKTVVVFYSVANRAKCFTKIGLRKDYNKRIRRTVERKRYVVPQKKEDKKSCETFFGNGKFFYYVKEKSKLGKHLPSSFGELA